MKIFLSIAVLLFLSDAAFGQKPQVAPTKKKPAAAKNNASKPPAKQATPVRKIASKPELKPTPAPTPVDPVAEKAKLDEVLAITNASERAAALKQFIRDFPMSEHRTRAIESLVTAWAILADEKLQANESNEGVALFKLAVEETPTPIPERLFNEIISKFPANLFYRDQRSAGIEIAEAIEKKAAGNVKQLLSLATFYLGIESGSDAKRLAEAAVAIDPNSIAAYQTLGLAHRLNFDLAESAKAYSKALEIDNSSVTSKRSLAEMKRALGKPDEAAALYREIVTANENDAAAKTGLILSLFGGGKKAEAEIELAKSLEQNPKNLSLLAGAAYWYAANDLGDKAVELAQKAVELEPRYIWGHIALARGLMSQKKPVEAERVLVMARQYGNFPTLEYEIASARLMAGFYREAVEELQKSFAIKDGLIQTRLGGRVAREEKSFGDLIAYERQASIFEPLAADNPENSAKLKLLLEISQKLATNAPDETELSTLTDEFVKGDDKMKLHRQLYSATILLQKNAALPKVLELVKAAVGNTDAGLEVSTPAAAVMASELYESRTIAFARNEIIVVPEVPRQTLSAILRGRIEELTGWTLYQQKSYPEAIVRLRRAISVLPDKSAWWRSSMWRLGAALEADGKDKEALDSYIQSYKTDRPNALRYGVVEALYKKVIGSTEGLEAKIGPNPLPVVAAEPVKASETNSKPAEPPTTRVETTEPSEKLTEKTSAAGTSINSAETSRPKADAAITPEKQNEAKTPIVELPSKVAENIQPKVEDAVPTNKQDNAMTQVPGAPIKTTETTEPKTANAVISDKQSEPKAGVPDTSVKAAANILPKAEIAAPDAQGKTPSPEAPARTVETTQPKVDDTAESKKQDEPRLPAVEPPAKAADESQSNVENTKTEIKDPEFKTSSSEAQKSDPSSQVPAKTDTSSNEPKNPLRDPLSEVEPEPKVEPSTEKPANPQTGLKAENTPEKKPAVIISDPVGDGKKAASTKDLFEPVIIRVPNGSVPKSSNKDEEKRAETVTEAPKKEPDKPVETEKKAADDDVSSGASRVRVVDGKEIKSDTQCSLEFSQETISLIGGGGSLGILVSIVGEGDFKDVVAKSSSPRDVEVRAEPEITGISGRRFYVVKSISTAEGVYQVIFESKCGKKGITVRVR